MIGSKVVNLEQGMPSSRDAVRRLTYELNFARETGVRVLKLIHGYGSSGKGGRIRLEVRQYLERQRGRLIVELIPGEKFSIFEPNARKLLDTCPELRQDADLERHNNGVTFVLL